MRRLWLCLAIAVGILVLTGYSTYQVRNFTDEIDRKVAIAVDCLEREDFPAAYQAVSEGAALCEKMRRKSVLYLRTEDFIQVEESLRSAGGYLIVEAKEEAWGELSQAMLRTEKINWITHRWL